MQRTTSVASVWLLLATTTSNGCGDDLEELAPFPVVDTGQNECYDIDSTVISCPEEGETLAGQDADYGGQAPRYLDNGDGTVTDEVTQLTWQQALSEKMTFDEAMAAAESLTLAGYDDWRLPTVKELYSLINFDGQTGSASPEGALPDDAVPYLDDSQFEFEYGDTSAGERYIDAQYWSSTEYVSTTMNGDPTVFGVNFADGRIKGYSKTRGGSPNSLFVRFVRGKSGYGENVYEDTGDGTVKDETTGLIWMQRDSGAFDAGDGGAMPWQQALAFCESLELAGNTDWRLPNAKELQSIVDYTRSPDTSSSAAIDPVFDSTSITDEGGGTNWPFYWTSTTHKDGVQGYAVYIAFGEALGCMAPPTGGAPQVMDVHGAGAQRSDPKSDQGVTLGCSNAPQGDVIRVNNFVRCVRG